MSSNSSSSWPRESISVSPDGTVIVDWKNAGLTDDTLNDFVTKRLSSLLACVPSKNGKATECSVILSGNRLAAREPITALLERLREARVHVTSLNFQKNMFTDSIHSPLCEHIRVAGSAGLPLASLHLGQNKLTEAAVRSITDAVLQSGAYPSPSVQHCRIWIESQSPPLRCSPDLEALGTNAKNEKAVCILLGASPKVSKGEGKGKGVEPCRSSTAGVAVSTSSIDGARVGGKANSSTAEVSVSTSSIDGARLGGKVNNGGGKGFKGRQILADDSLLAWLKQQRETSKEFEEIWKSWCAEHRLAGLPKSQRVEKIKSFKLEWESGVLHNKKNYSDSSVKETHEEFPKEGGTKDTKEVTSPVVAPAPLPALPQPHLPSPILKTRGFGVRSNRDSTQGMVPASSQGATARETRTPECTKSGTENQFTGATEIASIKSKAVAAVKLKLQRAIDMHALKESLTPDREPGSEWQRLAHIGNQVIEQGCSLRAFRLGGSFLDEDGLAELTGTCTSKSNLAKAYCSLKLIELVHDDSNSSDRQKAGSLAAIVGELQDSSAQTSCGPELALRSEASKSILDFVFLFGYRSIGNAIATTKGSASTPAVHETTQNSTSPLAMHDKSSRPSPCEDWLSTPTVDSAINAATTEAGSTSEQRQLTKAQLNSLLSLAESVPDQCKGFPIGSRVVTIRRDKCIVNSKISDLLQLKRWDNVHKKIASDEHYVVTGSCLWKDDPTDTSELEIAIVAVRDQDGNDKVLDVECLQRVSLEALGKSHFEALQDYIDSTVQANEIVDMAMSSNAHAQLDNLNASAQSSEGANSKQPCAKVLSAEPELKAHVLSAETEMEARERRSQAQSQRRTDQKWNYTGTSRSMTSEVNAKESNQEAMHRMLGSRLEGNSSVVARPKTSTTASTSTQEARHFKKHMCSYWEAGKCTKGSQCTFAHGPHEMK